jgi:predicted phosphodiesterase
MRRLLRKLLLKPILWAASRFSSQPDRLRIFSALSKLLDSIKTEPGKKGPVIPFSRLERFIIFSDQHKGRKNGADDFVAAEPNYLKALEFYYQQGFHFINLGDSEELWENSLGPLKKANLANFEAEKKFLSAGRYIKVFGNHDLFWDNDPLASWHLKQIFGLKCQVYEGVVLQYHPGVDPIDSSNDGALKNDKRGLTIFLTHGHQGDASSDGNWFSKFFVAQIWAPLQAFLRINPNTPAYDAEKKTLHNHIMYEWSAEQKDLWLITGHTHQPVFCSLTHLERLYKKYQFAELGHDKKLLQDLREEIRKRERDFTSVAIDYMNMRPTYFNTGCCCFSDGDITGIEIIDGNIQLIKWSIRKGREVLEVVGLEDN